LEPLAIVLTVFAALIVISRGALVVAPTATLEWSRRVLSTPARVRLFAGWLGLLGASLVVTARQASGSQGDVATVCGIVGWVLVAFAAVPLVAPAIFQRFIQSIFDAISDPGALRALGALGVAIGLALGWFALFAM
jgi:hypothetical protein